MSLATIGGTIFTFFYLDALGEEIDESQHIINKINYFSVNFNALLAVLRDIPNGLFEGAAKDPDLLIFDYYEGIQKFLGVRIFSNTTYTTFFNEEIVVGNLNELIEVNLYHIHEYYVKK